MENFNVEEYPILNLWEEDHAERIYDSIGNSPEFIKFNNKVKENILTSKEVFFDRTKLYHITSNICLDKIKKIGLVPKSKNSIIDYPDRIYVIEELNDEYFENLSVVLSKINESSSWIKKMELLEIDTGKLDNVHFYEDSRMKCCSMYTYDNIPSQAITHIKTIQVK